jgi:hypothetical protein
MMEKFFSVVAELADGTTQVLSAKGQSSGDAFRQVRERPDVRRVGRVSEITPAGFDNLERSGPQPVRDAAPEARPGAMPGRDSAPIEHKSPNWVGHVISGPRTVVYAPPAGGEQPFKNLNIPPERLAKPKPVPPPAPKPQPVVAKPAPAAPAVASEESSSPLPMPAAETAAEYRIYKSRRQDGLPYLLQRGQWQQLKGKRAFDVQWEKGFAEREQAERHLEWVTQNEREMAEFQQSA